MTTIKIKNAVYEKNPYQPEWFTIAGYARCYCHQRRDGKIHIKSGTNARATNNAGIWEPVVPHALGDSYFSQKRNNKELADALNRERVEIL